jgi:hypothetical protein
MALSSENSGRRPRRLTRPAVPTPFPAVPDAPAAAAPAPPSIPTPPPAAPAAPGSSPIPAPPDASEVQSIPLVPGASAAPDPLPAPGLPGEMPSVRADAPVPDAPEGPERRKPAASPVPDGAPAPAPRARNPRWVWLAVLLLLLVLGGALAYLLWPANRVSDRFSRSVGGAIAATRTRVAGWFGRERTAVTNLPAAGAAAPAEAASPLSRPIRQAQQVIGAVEAVREDLPPELMARAAEDGTANATSPPSAAPPPEPVPPAPRPESEPPPEARPAAPVVPAVVEWPDVEVSAVVGSGRRGSAIINGQVMVIGEESEEGLQLERIEPQAAVLRYRGATRRFIVRKR